MRRQKRLRPTPPPRRIDLAGSLTTLHPPDVLFTMNTKRMLSGSGKTILILLFFSLTGCGTYNRLVMLEQTVNKKWADVQSVYQRRADLIPNLVNTVSGAANFEKSTLTEVTSARASVGQV